MIHLTLTPAQGRRLAELTDDATVLNAICEQLRLDQVCDDGGSVPKVIIFQDDGEGLRIGAVAYHTAEAADRAFDRFWELVVKREAAQDLFPKALY